MAPLAYFAGTNWQERSKPIWMRKRYRKRMSLMGINPANLRDWDEDDDAAMQQALIPFLWLSDI